MFINVKNNETGEKYLMQVAEEGMRLYSTKEHSGHKDLLISNKEFILDYKVVGPATKLMNLAQKCGRYLEEGCSACHCNEYECITNLLREFKIDNSKEFKDLINMYKE